MIFVTGDCHGEFLKLSGSSFPEQNEMTKDDIVIICGDFGAVWDCDGASSARCSVSTEFHGGKKNSLQMKKYRTLSEIKQKWILMSTMYYPTVRLNP